MAISKENRRGQSQRKKKNKLRRKEEERTSVRKPGISSLLRKTAGCLPIGMRQGELRVSIDWKIKIILIGKKKECGWGSSRFKLCKNNEKYTQI